MNFMAISRSQFILYRKKNVKYMKIFFYVLKQSIALTAQIFKISYLLTDIIFRSQYRISTTSVNKYR